MAEVLSTFSLRPGDPAPGFSLPDPDVRVHTLNDLRGKSGLLVVFACNHCPFVVHLAEVLGNFAREIAADGVGSVAICSNDAEKYPADAPDKMREFARQSGWEFPYLHDSTQEVAKSYGAACTPDFFLFGPDLKLHYAGQFDSSRPRNGSVLTGDDLRAAVKGMLAGDPPPERPYPSSGCNIKWIPGNEPAWFTRG